MSMLIDVDVKLGTENNIKYCCSLIVGIFQYFIENLLLTYFKLLYVPTYITAL